MWPLSSPDDGMVSPEMCTNLSRHTVSFGDMAWPESTPSFPKAPQVGQYLTRYIAKYSGIDIQTSSKVVKASRLSATSSYYKNRWKIEVERGAALRPGHSPTFRSYPAANDTLSSGNVGKSTQSNFGEPSLETHYFDYLIVASGFFGKPKMPSASSKSVEFTAPVQHSTEFRGIETLLKGTESDTARSHGSKILVVGGSMSGVETAASIAMQLSSHLHSPSSSQVKDVESYVVHHIVKRPFWVMPLFLPVKPLLEADADPSEVSHRFSMGKNMGFCHSNE